MAPARRHGTWLLRLATASLLLCAAPWADRASGQAPNAANRPVALPPAATAPAPVVHVLDIRIEGLRMHTREQVLNNMSTRIGRPFEQTSFEKDVRKLTSRNWFVHVVPKKEYVQGGVIITLSVVERPVLEYIRYIGNDKFKTRKLEKETGLKKGDSFDPYAVREAARKIETLYQSKGYSDVRVEVPEGTQPGDRGATFLIHEGKVLKFKDIAFKGNSPSVAPDGRLKKIIESREPFLGLFKGQVDRNKIESDVERLTEYYRTYGYFKATVGRSYEYNEDEDRMKLTFFINEGPRYNVRNITFSGNVVYHDDIFQENLKLTPGDPFDQTRMNADIGTIKDIYGSNGYVFADAVADLRFLEEPGELDLIYRVKEGEQHRIGDINVTIKGDNPHTRHATVLNRLNMRPGDIADIREFRASERRLKASGLFNVDPSKGDMPRITFSPPELDDDESSVARRSRERSGGDESIRGQSPDLVAQPLTAPPAHEPYRWPDPTRPAETARAPRVAPPALAPPRERGIAGTNVRAQSPDAGAGFGGRAVQPISPEPRPYATPRAPAYPVAQAQYAEPAQDPLASPNFPPSGGYVPQDFGNGAELIPTPPQQPSLPVDITVSEAQTGRFMLGAGINSNAGLVGSIILDEQNFDWRRFPTSWEDFRSGRAFRGAGQKFRIEAAPGTEVQRYLFNFAEPYWFDTPVSFGLSGYYFNRYYRDWMEQRLGGRVTLGYQFTPDLSGSVGLRAEDVLLLLPSNPSMGFDDNGVLRYSQNGGVVPPDLAAALGHTSLYSARASLAHDTRDSTFLPTEGHNITATFEYFMGTFQYPWFGLNAQQHWLLRERPDGTGRHTFSYYHQLGFSGPDTPIYERFYAGGFSTVRGFQFRGASPQQGAPGTSPILVGGDFQFLHTLEYMFPVTADDMFKVVAFVDFGTVESDVRINWDQFRIAPGMGIRLTIPMISPAPIAVDFAVPVKHADGDLEQIVSFFVGLGR